MTTALKPCPRCGGVLELRESDWSDPLTWHWLCPICLMRGRPVLSAAEAVADANDRPWTLMRAVRLGIVLGTAVALALFIVLMNLPAPIHEVRP